MQAVYCFLSDFVRQHQLFKQMPQNDRMHVWAPSRGRGTYNACKEVTSVIQRYTEGWGS